MFWLILGQYFLGKTTCFFQKIYPNLQNLVSKTGFLSTFNLAPLNTYTRTKKIDFYKNFLKISKFTFEVTQ